MNIGGGYIDTSWSSIRTLAILIMGIVWFYLLNQHIRDSENNDD